MFYSRKRKGLFFDNPRISTRPKSSSTSDSITLDELNESDEPLKKEDAWREISEPCVSFSEKETGAEEWSEYFDVPEKESSCCSCCHCSLL